MHGSHDEGSKAEEKWNLQFGDYRAYSGARSRAEEAEAVALESMGKAELRKDPGHRWSVLACSASRSVTTPIGRISHTEREHQHSRTATPSLKRGSIIRRVSGT